MRMDKNRLKLSKIIYGTARLHHIFSKKKRQCILRKVIDLGITHFDTSPYYGYGLAEKEIGHFIKKNPEIKISIATKFGIEQKINIGSNVYQVYLIKLLEKIIPYLKKPNYNYSVDAAKKSLNQSLQNLNLSKIDIFFIHEPKIEIQDYRILVQWLEEQVLDGKIGSWGFAGNKDSFMKWINLTNIVPPILQIKSEKGRPAKLSKFEKVYNISYGYISDLKIKSKKEIKKLLIDVLRNRKDHSIIISTNKLKNLEYIRSII